MPQPSDYVMHARTCKILQDVKADSPEQALVREALSIYSDYYQACKTAANDCTKRLEELMADYNTEKHK